MTDKAERGRCADTSGEQNGRATLTKEEVLAILHAIGTTADIARKHNVKYNVAYGIRTGKTWNDLTGLPVRHKRVKR